MSRENHNQILITISSLDEAMQRVRNAVKRLEAGLPPEQPIHRLSFVNEAIFLKTLSEKRMELLKFLKKSGPLSRRQLAIKLSRAYANVHEDVKVLLRYRLIKTNAQQKLFVPWDEIRIDMRLAA